MQPAAKPSMSDKLTGKFKVLVGKATHDPNKIIEGTAKETGQARPLDIPNSHPNSHSPSNSQYNTHTYSDTNDQYVDVEGEEDQGNGTYRNGDGDGERDENEEEETKLDTQISPPAGMAGSYQREKSLKKEESKLDGEAFECANGLKKDGKYEVDTAREG